MIIALNWEKYKRRRDEIGGRVDWLLGGERVGACNGEQWEQQQRQFVIFFGDKPMWKDSQSTRRLRNPDALYLLHALCQDAASIVIGRLRGC